MYHHKIEFYDAEEKYIWSNDGSNWHVSETENKEIRWMDRNGSTGPYSSAIGAFLALESEIGKIKEVTPRF
jgi:hypothetical protein